MKPWRKIVRRERVNEEHIGKGRGFTWWMVEVTTVYLECGHAKVYRGCGVPAQKVRCSECPGSCTECGKVCEPFEDTPEDVQALEEISRETGESVEELRAKRDAVSVCVACLGCGAIFVNGARHPRGLRFSRSESAEGRIVP